MTGFRLTAMVILGPLLVGTVVANDSDTYLRAISRRDASTCYTVVNADKRTMCIAEIKGDAAQCYSVIDPTVREECMARAKAKK